MATQCPPTHEHLLTLTNKVRAAIQDGDMARLRLAAQQLYDSLVEHLDGEKAILSKASPPQCRLLSRGQRRVVETAEALLSNVALPVRECKCQSLTELFAAELSLQAEDERRYLPVAGSDSRCARKGGFVRWSVPGCSVPGCAA